MLRKDGRKDRWMERKMDNVKAVYPLKLRFAGGIINPTSGQERPISVG